MDEILYLLTDQTLQFHQFETLRVFSERDDRHMYANKRLMKQSM